MNKETDVCQKWIQLAGVWVQCHHANVCGVLGLRIWLRAQAQLCYAPACYWNMHPSKGLHLPWEKQSSTIWEGKFIWQLLEIEDNHFGLKFSRIFSSGLNDSVQKASEIKAVVAVLLMLLSSFVVNLSQYTEIRILYLQYSVYPAVTPCMTLVRIMNKETEMARFKQCSLQV